ncbi:hypothetical protein B296_00010188 [Ensete ventricosum]|uniref:TFIIF beta subunit HTH domain-containing protein n=1 Tax=Ensete ventricosum TaxID=4639 RepID=A0A426YPY1_ENSVE|nr:hypothetical protein B296_00010188 [Ensete ventricosum]
MISYRYGSHSSYGASHHSLSTILSSASSAPIPSLYCYSFPDSTSKLSEHSGLWFKVIDKDHGVLMRPMPGMVGLVPSGSKLDILYCFDVFVHQDKKKLTPTKGSDAKRTRRDRRELENIIFKLFERQPNWALKQLVQETDQPEVCASTQTLCFYSTMKLIMTLSSYGLVRLLSTNVFNFSLQQFLKEILNDLCVYNKRGPNQGTHELKPEYKKSTEEMDNV